MRVLETTHGKNHENEISDKKDLTRGLDHFGKESFSVFQDMVIG